RRLAVEVPERAEDDEAVLWIRCRRRQGLVGFEAFEAADETPWRSRLRIAPFERARERVGRDQIAGAIVDHTRICHRVRATLELIHLLRELGAASEPAILHADEKSATILLEAVAHRADLPRAAEHEL